MTQPPPDDRGAAQRTTLGLVLTFAVAALAVSWTAVAVLDTAATWRAFSHWQPSEFTVSRYLASELFGLVRVGLPRRLLKYEGYLQGALILSWAALPLLATGVAWWARHRRRRQAHPRRALTWVVAILLVCLPVGSLMTYVSWQCIFVSAKEVFETHLDRQAAREGREPTVDEIVRASELGTQYDSWRRESLFHLFQTYRPRAAGSS